jgi:choline dehydrogenase-like flavoprotein
MTQADVIVVGSGPAGGMLARKLPDADVGHVLLLEASDHHADSTAIHNPADQATLWSTSRLGYKTTQETHTAANPNAVITVIGATAAALIIGVTPQLAKATVSATA